MSRLFRCSRLSLKRNVFTSKRWQHGFIILVPEIGEDVPDKNILVQSDGLPEFKNVMIENCMSAIAKQTLEFEAGVKKIEEDVSTGLCQDIFKEVFQPLEHLSTPLDMTWGLSKTLYFGNSTLMPTSSYMAIHERARKARASKYSNRGIYEAVKIAQESGSKRNSEESRILHKFAVEGKLNGLELDPKNLTLLTEYTNTLVKEKNAFRHKTEVSNKQFSHTITDEMVTRDFPPELLKATAIDPNFHMNGPWKLTLQPHVYMPALEYCSDRQIRWNMWQALVGRGSNYTIKELATSLHLEEIRFVKRDIAKVLGYETYADLSMETKMAGNVSEVNNMISSLLDRAKPAQDEEIKQLHTFAIDRGFQFEKLELWDLPYWRRKQQKSLFGHTENDFKAYFPLERVLDGLFQLCEKLFSITIRQRSNVSTWHKDVKFFDIFEDHTSAPVAGFYLDPYARSQQKMKVENSGWMVGIQSKSTITDNKPLAALIFNFDPPVDSKTPCLSLKEVR
ncbi:hypothetical protein JTB14_017793 [Gonioctena quinquepunctata]|nr:hypothetical protein JTB14_017793 [Gonioctena quinquepunctata]